MAKPKRCTVCGRWAKKGQSTCDPCLKRYYTPRKRTQYDDYDGFASDRPFFPESFGAIKDKFGIER